jgi:hypothetical protein
MKNPWDRCYGYEKKIAKMVKIGDFDSNHCFLGKNNYHNNGFHEKHHLGENWRIAENVIRTLTPTRERGNCGFKCRSQSLK